MIKDYRYKLCVDVPAVKWNGDNLEELVKLCGEDRIDVTNPKIPQIKTIPNRKTWVMLNTNEYVVLNKNVLMRLPADYFESEYCPVEDISDGYHSFKELYNYRKLYNAAFFNMIAQDSKYKVIKSKKHSNGKECFDGGWFIVMAELPTGQISNHYEMKDWDLFKIPEVDTAPEWDGHTPKEAAERLEKFVKGLY